MNLKDILKENNIVVEKRGDDEIQVQGIGMYTYETLKAKVQKLAKDLQVNAKRGNWNKSSRNGIRAFAEMWSALTEYER